MDNTPEFVVPANFCEACGHIQHVNRRCQGPDGLCTCLVMAGPQSSM